MASRRMFAKTIIDSDLFLDMSLSAQALYFHLSMRADDDGFVNNPKKIQRMLGASDDDLKILLAKRFLIPFESGIVVIKHWKIHNYIKNDRYKETVYRDEKEKIIIKENKEYELQEGELGCIQNGTKMDTQVRLGKVRLGKDRLGKKIHTSKNEGETIKKIVDLYNEICISLPKVQKISEPRKRTIKTRLKTYSVEDFETLFKKAEASNFLTGGGDKGWKANFDWLLEEKHMVKVLEDLYIDRDKKSKANQDMENAFKMMAEWAKEED